MWNRIVRNSFVAGMIFLLPAIARPDHLRHPAPWLAAAIALLILLSQPPVDFKVALSRHSGDRGSALGIFVAMIGAQVVSSVEFASRPTSAPGSWFALGVVMVFAGLVLRLWAIHTLGRFFTSTVQVGDGQRVVRSGPYRMLRHPSYAGALLTAFGTALVLHSSAGAALVITLCVPAYLYRVATEERALVAELGADYAEYRRHTWGIVPGVR